MYHLNSLQKYEFCVGFWTYFSFVLGLDLSDCCGSFLQYLMLTPDLMPSISCVSHFLMNSSIVNDCHWTVHRTVDRLWSLSVDSQRDDWTVSELSDLIPQVRFMCQKSNEEKRRGNIAFHVKFLVFALFTNNYLIQHEHHLVFLLDFLLFASF